MTPKPKLARLAGLLYLIVAISGGFAELFVRQSLVVPDEAAATASNIADSAMLFRVGFVADFVNFSVFLLLGFALYQLLKPVNQQIAATFVIFNAIAVAIMGANLLNHFAALLVASNPQYAAALGTESSEALVLFFAELHAQGYLIGGIFFGLWLLPLGYLVYKSGYFPRVLGIMLMVGCFGYLTDTFVSSLLPSVGASVGLIFAMVAGIAEISFLLWLLIMGAKIPQRDEQTLAAGAGGRRDPDVPRKLPLHPEEDKRAKTLVCSLSVLDEWLEDNEGRTDDEARLRRMRGWREEAHSSSGSC